MALGSRAEDFRFALQKAKKKISNLQQQLSNQSERGSGSESPSESRLLPWTPSRELRDTLVDMYSANPKVNEELHQRLPSPSSPHLDRSGISWSLDLAERPQASCLPPPQPLRTSPVSPVSPVTLRRPPGGMDTDLSPRRGPSPRAESVTEGGGASRCAGGSAPRSQLVSGDNSSHQDTAQSFNRDKNISFLLKELDTLRDINKKLQEQLVQKEEELQRREVEEQLKEEHSWERPSVLMEEVLAAQVSRDQAVMSRLLLANEERDEALLRVRSLQHTAECDAVAPDDVDADIDELLQQISEASLPQVDRLGAVLMQRLRSARQRRSDITAQEMKAVMEERDSSIAKCKRLEQDLIQHRTEQEELLRSRALEDQWKRGAEPQMLPANHSDGGPAAEAPPLQVQVQRLWREKENMEAELQRSQEAERAASERVHRLERLVEVLRKKVGAGSLRAVS